MIQLIILSPEDLTNPKIIECAKQHKVMLVINKPDERVRTVANTLMQLLRPLKGMLNGTTNMRWVREYITRLTEDNYDLFDRSVQDDARLAKLVCQVAGSLAEYNVLRGTARELADKLPRQRYCLESRRRYVNDGRHRREFLESFRAVDDAVPNRPS